jgi:hypothetical protein
MIKTARHIQIDIWATGTQKRYRYNFGTVHEETRLRGLGHLAIFFYIDDGRTLRLGNILPGNYWWRIHLTDIGNWLVG